MHTGHAPLLHLDEGVRRQVAQEIDFRLDAPEVVNLRQQRVVVEKAAEVATPAAARAGNDSCFCVQTVHSGKVVHVLDY